MKKNYLLSLFMIIVLFGGIMLVAKREVINASEGISANNALRFHVIANSDSNMDQEIKLKVRDRILEKFYQQIEDIKSKDEALIYLSDNLVQFKKVAETVLLENNFDYHVQVVLTEEAFPTKKYYQFTAPAGEYQALKVILGEGEGANWWCVLFPPLCLVDITKSNSGLSVINEENAVPTMGKIVNENYLELQEDIRKKNKLDELIDEYKVKLDKLLQAQ